MADQIQKFDRSLNPHLSPNQQDLLLAALNSQAGGNRKTHIPTGDDALVYPFNSAPAHDSRVMAISNDALLASPEDADFDSFGADYTPDMDFVDGDSFDFDNADLGGDMIGALPGSEAGSKNSEKRKSPDEDDDDPESDPKRQETQEGEKQAKKPGRKPLTNEPTTKRKAQNRAAQRAFRERKEKHLKDLETKVSEMTKASEADKQENGLLKAQVDRLQVELREYRKRLSLNNSSASGSPPLTVTTGQHRSNSNPSHRNSFQFDFPRFGGLPGSQMFGTPADNSGILKRTTSPAAKPSTNTQPAQTSRHDSTGSSMSPHSNQGGESSVNSSSQFADLHTSIAAYSTNDNMHGFASTLPQMSGAGDPFGDLFSPSILKSTSPNSSYFENPQSKNTLNGLPSASTDHGLGNDSTSGFNRVFQFNSSSNASDSTSPSASSSSPWNANGTCNSSCGTSPEPSNDSPAIKDIDKANSTKQNSASHLTNNSLADQNASFGVKSTDYSMPSLSTFDPVLFGDYRDSNDAIVGGGDFSGGFFDDALNSAPFDMGSPSNLFGILSPQQTRSASTMPDGALTAPSHHLMSEMEKARDGGDEDYGLSNSTPKTENAAKLVSCSNIWDQLQSNTDFQNGTFDLDGLCSELRAKATCAESGVMVPQTHVDAALRKLGKKDGQGQYDPPPLMFEQQSWDNVLKKLQAGKQ